MSQLPLSSRIRQLENPNGALHLLADEFLEFGSSDPQFKRAPKARVYLCPAQDMTLSRVRVMSNWLQSLAQGDQGRTP